MTTALFTSLREIKLILTPSSPEYTPYNQAQRVLFLCTGNSARSQMAEALLRHLSQNTFESYSAGNLPRPIHPYALDVLKKIGIDTTPLYPKHLDLFHEERFQRVITICDRVHETCPIFPLDQEHIHWGFPDPARVQGTEEQQYRAFEVTLVQLTFRIRQLLIFLRRMQR